MKRYHTYNFEGIIINVLLEFDNKIGKYIGDFPDFEEEPLFTPSGKPLVSAVQDRCGLLVLDGNETDCGSCMFYQPNHPGDLIGVCINPAMARPD